MAEAIVGKIEEKLLDKIWDYTVAQIAKQFRYVFFFNGNIEELKTHLEKLQRITQGVQVRVDADDVQLKVTAPHVKDWLKSANDVEREAEEIIKEKPKVKKGCLNGWCPNLKLRYSLSRKAVKTNKVIVDLQEEGKQYAKQSCSPPPPSTKPIPNEDYTAFESRSLDMEKIIKALKKDKINLIGILGLPGVGKSTMAKEVAKRAIEYRLFVEVVWADVKREPELTDVQAHIGNMLGLDEFGKDASLKARACHLRERLLQDKKILVILDDVWKEFDLQDVGLPLGGANKNFKILYTSRFRGLWHDKKTIKFEIPLQLLSNEEARELFKKQVGDCADAPDLQPIAEEIVNACRCLPIALVLIGKALSNESGGNFTKYIWEDMQRRLTCSRSTPEDMDWSSTLEPSYQAIEHEETKRLFLLCCLFNKGKSIPVEFLVRYALGFSLFDDQIEGMSNVRARVFTLVADLERRYLLLDNPSKTDHKHVSVHDLVRDMGVSIASKCKGALGSQGTISEYPKKDAYDRYALVSHGAVSKWPNKDKFQHYTSISVISKEIIELPEELTCPNLEFLLLLCRKPENLSCHFFKGMGKLKVLELFEYPGIIPTLQPLTNLTMLSLNGLYRGDPDYVPVIEPVIGYLLNLEILSFRNLGIKKLPEEIGKLVKLRLLDLTRTSRLETITPLVISRLVRLEELYMLGSKFSYWEGEGEEKGINANLREFEHLSDLNTLEITIRGGVLIPKVAMLFSKLKKYKVTIKSTDNMWYFRDMQYERELLVGTWLGRDIRADHGGLDSLLMSSDHISLRSNDLVLLQDNDLVRLQDGVDRLQQLKFLEIESCKTPKCLVQQPPYAAVTAVFPILEKLHLQDIDGLREICHFPIPAGSFGQLTEIQIYDCNSLKYLFPLPVVGCLTQLKSLEIQRCAKMEEVIWKEQPEDVHIATNNRIEFPMLESLSLEVLPSLFGFCRGVDEINFPQLKDLFLCDLSKLEHIVHDNSNLSTNSEPNNNVGSLSLFPQMVTFPSLEKLGLHELQNVRNVFYPSLVAVFVNLQTLTVNNCSKMETIVDWEEGKEREIPKTLFPQLMNLELKSLPCLMRFCNFTHPIELPLLSKIDISSCRSMTAFCSGPVSAPNFYLQGVSGNIDDAIEFMQKEDQRVEEEERKEEEQRKEEAEEMAKGKGWPMKVKHEFHEHDLELIQRLSYTCDGCEEGGKDWSFYCKDCDFDLHPKCALEENKATKGDNKGGLEEGATTKGWPKKVKHELHEHELELIVRRNYICDGCKERGKLLSFYCKYCDFGLHRKCALEQNKPTKGDNEDGLEEGATTKEGWVCN